MNSAVTELLLRYELGDFDSRVRARLAAIFEEDPPDAVARLERAATFLELGTITRSTLDRADALLSKRSRADLQNASNRHEVPA